MNAPHLTAIRRRAMSAPAKELQARGRIQGRVLDFGCGHGRDAKELSAERFDPYWSPEMPAGTFDTVLCSYVVNVLPEDQEVELLDALAEKLAPGGCVYITVRRDLAEDTATQRVVVLDLPVVLERRGKFCTYVLQG